MWLTYWLGLFSGDFQLWWKSPWTKQGKQSKVMFLAIYNLKYIVAGISMY